MAADSCNRSRDPQDAAEPCAVVFFGASGDLAKRKVIPAMFDLAVHQSLGPRYAIVGFARTPMSDEDFRASLGEAAKSISEVGPIDPKQWDAFAANLHYSQGDTTTPKIRTRGWQSTWPIWKRQKNSAATACFIFHAAGSLSPHRGAIGQSGLGQAVVGRFLGEDHH